MTPIQSKSQFAAQLTGLLSRYPTIRLAILFGSQATPERQKHFDSDIDLAIMTDTPVSDCFKRQLIETISTELGCPVDIVNINEAPEPIFAEYIIETPSVRRYKCRVARQTVLLR